MERNTAAFLATMTVATAATITGGWTLLTGTGTPLAALIAVVLGPAAIVCTAAVRTGLYHRPGMLETNWYIYVTSRILTGAAAAAALTALTARSDRLPAWILAAVLVYAGLCAVWLDSDPYGPVRTTAAVAGAMTALAIIGAGTYIVAGTIGAATAAVAATVVAAAFYFSSPSTGHTPLPPEVGWLGPVIIVATSAISAKPLADQFGGHGSGSAAVLVTIGSIVAAAQWTVMSAVVRMLWPTVGPAPAIERSAFAARTIAAEIVGRRHFADPGDSRSPAAYREIAKRIRDARSRVEREAVEWTLERAHSYDTIDIDPLVREYEQSAYRASRTPRRPRPLVSSETMTINVATARDEGVVIDRIWPRLELVLPAAVRSRHAWSDRAVALSRVVTATGIAAAITFAAASLFAYAIPPLLLGSLALFAGRAGLEEEYRRRAAAIALFRTDLIHALRLPEPTTRAELLVLGGVLDGDMPFDRLATPNGKTGAEPAAGNTAQFSALIDELRTEMRVLSERQRTQIAELVTATAPPPDLGRIAAQLAEATAARVHERLQDAVTALRVQADESVTRVVRAVLAGPPLIEFSGYFAIELAEAGAGAERAGDRVITASPGVSIRLSASVVADEAAADVAPDRGAATAHDFVALEIVTIAGTTAESEVEFEVLLDSATMTPVPRRRVLRLPRRDGERRGEIELELPASEGVHEAWLQLYQAGRLIQAVTVVVDTRLSDRSTRAGR
ncbi:hypothetical protein [Nocardia asteroides]|uniref:hypothetical protein n=1 Tax=Nocardia asteroides TaxID=1824 RepID=UPI001E408DA3|nr:hypothetical protein [Nocardia asteroides]UGT61883.1 hypothetical protein LTT61_00560 [Nocardia asteroides]